MTELNSDAQLKSLFEKSFVLMNNTLIFTPNSVITIEIIEQFWIYFRVNDEIGSGISTELTMNDFTLGAEFENYTDEYEACRTLFRRLMFCEKAEIHFSGSKRKKGCIITVYQKNSNEIWEYIAEIAEENHSLEFHDTLEENVKIIISFQPHHSFFLDSLST